MTIPRTSKFIILGSLYFTQGIPNGFFRHTVPVVFRERGLTLEDIALFLPALYLPWVLKFLWSIVVERFHSKKQGKYRSWIIPLQILTAGTMVALANWQFGASLSIFVLGVALINIFSSMQDVSTDGHAVELLGYKERGWGNAVQVGTFWIGYVAGGGLILILMNKMGWNFLLIAMSIVTFLSTLPILILKQTEKNITSHSSQNPAKNLKGLRAFLSQPKIIKVLGLVAAFRLIEGFIRSLLPTMFKDWGMNFQDIGLILGIVAPISALVGALLAGYFINRLGRLSSLLAFGSLQIISSCGYMVLCMFSKSMSLSTIVPVVILDHVISGMTTVALFSLMMDWSRKRHGGTDYTAMDCIGVFAMMLGASSSYLIAAKGGYFMSFATAIPLIVFSMLIVRALYFQIQNDEHWKNLNKDFPRKFRSV
ncbi:MFS transporter [Opitutales bacterium]|nr:MFS transporter [Opitutales bacterium]